MQSLVIFTCALAIASAGYVAPIGGGIVPAYTTYPGPQHLPVIGPNGVPVDTPAVQQATAEHLHQKVEAHVRNGDYVAPVYPAGYPTYGYPTYGYPTYGYPTYPTVPAAGVPLDTPEVVAAKAVHFAAHAKALAQTGHVIAKRGIIAAYPAAAYSAPAYPTVYNSYSPLSYDHHSAAVIYRKRRGIVTTPVAYSGYYNTPVSSYSAYPFAHYY